VDLHKGYKKAKVLFHHRDNIHLRQSKDNKIFYNFFVLLKVLQIHKLKSN